MEIVQFVISPVHEDRPGAGADDFAVVQREGIHSDLGRGDLKCRAVYRSRPSRVILRLTDAGDGHVLQCAVVRTVRKPEDEDVIVFVAVAVDRHVTLAVLSSQGGTVEADAVGVMDAEGRAEVAGNRDVYLHIRARVRPEENGVVHRGVHIDDVEVVILVVYPVANEESDAPGTHSLGIQIEDCFLNRGVIRRAAADCLDARELGKCRSSIRKQQHRRKQYDFRYFLSLHQASLEMMNRTVTNLILN